MPQLFPQQNFQMSPGVNYQGSFLNFYQYKKAAPIKRWLSYITDLSKNTLDSVSNVSPKWKILGSTVLGMVPVVGQLIDAYSIVMALRDLSKNPKKAIAWFDLITAVIGLIPGFGDAVKGGLRMLYAGGRTRGIDAVLAHLRHAGFKNPAETLKKSLNLSKIKAKLNILLRKTKTLTTQIGKGFGKLLRTIAQKITKAVTRFADHVKKEIKSRTPSSAKGTKTGGGNSPKKQPDDNESTNGKNQVDNKTQKNTGNYSRVSRQVIDSMMPNVRGQIGEHMADYYHMKKVGAKWSKHGLPHKKGKWVSKSKTVDAKNKTAYPVEMVPTRTKLGKVTTKGIDTIWLETSGKYHFVEAKTAKNEVVVLKKAGFQSKKLKPGQIYGDKISPPAGLTKRQYILWTLLTQTKNGLQMSEDWIEGHLKSNTIKRKLPSSLKRRRVYQYYFLPGALYDTDGYYDFAPATKKLFTTPSKSIPAHVHAMFKLNKIAKSKRTRGMSVYDMSIHKKHDNGHKPSNVYSGEEVDVLNARYEKLQKNTR